MEKTKRIIVQKYGGSSISTPERIKFIARKIKEIKYHSNPKNTDMVVVVSAMGSNTNELFNLARQICSNPAQRELDMLLTAGERISMSLMAMALENEGVPAISFTGSQSGILTDTFHTKAKIVQVKGFRITDELARGKVVVVAGFQGVSSDKEVTTLGRGGSDTTAVALAAFLKADLCEIFTDVNGVYTADPRIVPDARFINRCSYDEMMEMAFLGAKVLHYRSVEMASRFNIPLVVRSSFTFNGGTTVDRTKPMEEVQVRSITQDRDISKVTILSLPEGQGATSEIFRQIGNANVSIKLIVQARGIKGEQNITLVVSRNDTETVINTLTSHLPYITKDNIIVNNDLARISVVGYGISHTPGIQGRIFSCLANEGIRIDDISSSNISISFLINENEVIEAIQALHKDLNEMISSE
jgi:aspartate kinase